MPLIVLPCKCLWKCNNSLFFSNYSRIMPDSGNCLLFRKLCRHNHHRPIPKLTNSNVYNVCVCKNSHPLPFTESLLQAAMDTIRDWSFTRSLLCSFSSDGSFLLTVNFVWKTLVITAASCIPLFIAKFMQRWCAPSSYTKLLKNNSMFRNCCRITC